MRPPLSRGVALLAAAVLAPSLCGCAPRSAGEGRAVSTARHVVLILDSVPFPLAHEAWTEGRFPGFHEPRQLVSVFPAMTDPALTELFGLSPCPAVESEYFDGRRRTAGMEVYLAEANMAWRAAVDYRLTPAVHGLSYLWPESWLDHELRQIVRRLGEPAAPPRFVGYVVSTSGIGSKRGAVGHRAALRRVADVCAELRRAGATRVTLLSDHGHCVRPSRKLELAAQLRTLGYRVADALRGPRDVVVPAFGLVSCAALHTHSPGELARDAARIDGVDFCATRDDDRVVVTTRDAQAEIVRRGDALAYRPRHGDPLGLAAIVESLMRDGRADADGFAASRTWLEATIEHDYPDAPPRLWRAFHGLLRHVPDVLVSLEDGWYAGGADIDAWIEMNAVHGSLRRESSTGFVMTSVGELPAGLRIADLADEMRRLGAPLDARE